MSESPAPLVPQTLMVATERLQRSRQLMRSQMIELNTLSAQAQEEGHGEWTSTGWLAALGATPVVGPLISDAVSWWEGHPLRAVASLLVRPTSSTNEALTQRHPWAWVLGAAAAGALLIWARPWRYATLRRAIYSGLLPQVVSTLMSQVPTSRLIELVETMWRRTTPDEPPSGSSEPRQPLQVSRNDVAYGTLH